MSQLRKVISTFATAALVSFPAGFVLQVAEPAVASAATCGSLNWGVKQSFRAYIMGRIAQGGWEMSDGAGFTGDATGPDGAFTFPRTEKAIIDSPTSGTIPFGGRIRFSGHAHYEGRGPLLDMSLWDLKVRINGQSAQLLADYDATQLDGMHANAKQLPNLVGDDVAIVEIALDNAPDLESDSVDLSGTTRLTADGDRLFMSNYGVGTEMDRTSGVVGTKSNCGSSNGSSGSNSGGGTTKPITGNFTGTNKEVIGLLSETNDTMNALTTFMGNSQIFVKKIGEFTGNGGANTATNNSTRSGASNGNTTAKSAGANPPAQNGPSAAHAAGTAPSVPAAVASASGNTAGAAAQAGQSGVCAQGDAKGVEKTSMSWGIKKSFQSYITGSIAQGSWTLNGIEHSNQQFHFPGSSGAVTVGQKSGTLVHSGSVHFTGHHGVLDLTIADPEVQFNGNQGELIANVKSSDIEGNRTDYGRVALATISFNTLDVTDTQVSGQGQVFLSAVGANAFANFYEPGLEIDPISFTATLGGQANCATGAAGATAPTSGSSAAGASGTALGSSEAEGTTTGYKNGAENFKIRTAAANSSTGGMETSSYLLLALVAFVVAGGSMGRLVMVNPS
ncbi:Htaa protein [Corynebacterium kutscheri]|uniref:Htaa protein n=1 Tax=Corynebacterium kutscheri TaxID=35755 RepID=A0A0F6QZD4_9CORY|nr:HtaA domain-containing protein [Corynebacterium kutscheri]AKE40655.1 Htaa protein [Corynebacterium kutscheri]VEH11052.1 cell-surface hemin receptor [Corynebacterium kutscheri]